MLRDRYRGVAHSILPRNTPAVSAEARAKAHVGLLTDADKALIESTWKLIVPIQDTAADLFYRRLFELAPNYRPLFKNDLEAQKRKLIGMLGFIVKGLKWPQSAWQEDIEARSDLFMVVLALGRRHRELYKVPDEAYATVREALLWTLDFGLGEAFTLEAKHAWSTVYDLVSMTMKIGQGATEMGTPMEAEQDGEHREAGQ